MMKTILLVLAAGAAFTGMAKAGKPENPASVIFLHGWLPESGPLPVGLKDYEAILARSAEAARRGDFQSSTKSLDALLKVAPDDRARYLILLFRYEVIRRQSHLAGGSDSIADDAILLRTRRSKEQHAALETARELASKLGPEDRAQFEAIRKIEQLMGSCMEIVPTYRYAVINSQLAAEEEKAAKDEETNCTGELVAAPDVGDEPERARVSRALIAKLIHARFAMLLRGDIQSARSELRSGFELAQQNHWPATAALWLLHVGDLEAAPRGSVLTFGYELGAEPIVRSALEAGKKAGIGAGDKKYEQRDASANDAAAFYERARELNRVSGSLSGSDFALRDAYLKNLHNVPSARAFINAANLARNEHASWNETMAWTCAGLLGESRDDFSSAIRSSVEEANAGAVISMVQLSLSWAERAAVDGDSGSAIAVLRALADTLAGHGLEASRADVLMKIADLESALGRKDAYIALATEAISERKQFLAAVHDAQASADKGAAGGERIAETDVSERIGMDLMQLAFQLYQSEVLEGLVELTERRESALDESRELLAPLAKENPQLVAGAQLLLEKEFAQLKVTAEQVDRFRKLGTCTGILRNFNSTRATLQTHGDTAIRVGSLIMAGSCDPALFETARQELERLKPIEAVQLAVEKARSSGDAQAELDLENAVNRAEELLALADRAGAGQLMDQWTKGLDDALKKAPMPLMPSQELSFFHARALEIMGQYGAARDLLLAIRKDEPHWSYRAPPVFRVDVLSAMVEAEVELGNATAALLASEMDQAERQRSDELASGIAPGNPDSAEAAMLLRRAALNGNFDRGRLAELERRTAPSTREFQSPTIEDLRSSLRSLPSNTMTLVYYPLRHKLAIWRIEPEADPSMISVSIGEAELGRLAVLFRAKLAGEETGWEPAAEKLYQYLIAPVGPIAAGKTIAVIGIDRLGGIPFDALRNSAGSLLIQTNPIVYVSALADKTNPPALGNRRTKALVVGINAGGLTAPEAEAEAVAARMNTRALTGNSATLEQVRQGLPAAKLVHFATHGVLDAKNPYQSYLSLSDGRLEAWAVFGEAGGADLIVFSACDTRRGPRLYMKQFSSDESSISGLASRAGAKRIISSLWGAGDLSTKALMEAFYAELARDPSEPARALQSAKLMFAGQNAHPYAYANFVLSIRNAAAIRMNP